MGYSTLLGKYLALDIRGDDRSIHRRCPDCGHHNYIGFGGRYILNSGLTGAPIYESNDTQLIVNSTLGERLKQHKWRKLGIWKLPVREEPRDGLPAVFDADTPERFRKFD